MNIDALHSLGTARTTRTRSIRFLEENPSAPDSLGDWRPGAAPRKLRPRKQLDAFTRAQKEKLLQLRAAVVNSMSGVVQDTRADTSDSSVFATHNADAASDACDRDLALRLLSQEKNALIEIEEALERIESGSYGICEMSGQLIPLARLEALPFARFTVKWQSEVEQRRKLFPGQGSLSSLFTVADEEEIGEQEESPSS